MPVMVGASGGWWLVVSVGGGVGSASEKNFARTSNYRNRSTCMHENRKPCSSFLMINIASGKDRGTCALPHDDGATQHGQPRHAALAYSVHLFDLENPYYDTCQNKVSARSVM